LRIRIPTKITPNDAIKLQQKLAPLIIEARLPFKITNLVGCDAAYFQENTFAAATLVNYESLQLLRTSSMKEKTRFPYLPGLLAFREGPPVLRTIRALKPKSYVCLVDAHGRAHPRKFGLACFVGLALDQPTIGVAKTHFYGSLRDEGVFDDDGTQLAATVKLPESEKTIYVSVGHRICLTDAVKIVKHCLTKHGPLPIRLAHEQVTKQAWLLKKSNLAYS